MSPISQETGEMVIPQGQTLQTEEDGRGKGLINGQFIEEADGSITGTAHVADLDICADVPQYKKKQSAAGRTAADKDGTTHELSGGWNHLASPIHVWRRANGKLEVISGRHRLAHAKKNGIDKLQVRVYEETETQNTEWAKLHDVELNIFDNTCNAIDIAFFFRNNPMSEAEAESRGLMPKTLVGEQTAASRIGLTIANKACDDVYTALINGQCTAEEAYTCCNIASTEAGQKLALEQRQQSKKTSWEYVTAYVRQAEQMQYSSKQLDLFGNDIGWQDEAEKVAKYTSRARTQIKDRINLLRSSQRVEKRQDIAKELGVEIKTPEDASKLIGNLLILDSQYEHLDPTLAISTKAQEWDGTSQIKLDLSAGSSFSINTLKRASDAFEQVDKQEPIFIDVPEARDEDMKTVKARMRKALDEMRQAGGFLLSGKYHVNITTLGFKEVAHHVGNRKNAEIFCKLPEVAKHARFMYSAKNTDAGKRSKQDIKRFHYYLSKIIDSAGHEYYVLLNIAEKNDGSLFYDLDNELSIDVITTKSTVIDLPRARIPNAGLTNNEGAFMSRLQHTYAAVKHYRENNQNNSSFSLSLTPQQQERTPQFFNWFGDWVNTPKEASKVVDSDGSPLVVYHGSIDEFTIFDKDKASAESNVGAGFYFTNNAEDVAANYAGGGPDFNNKVALLAERKADEEDIDYDKAKEIIEQELIKTDKTFEVYLDIKNPVYIGKNETCITYEDVIEDYMAKDDYDEDDYYDGAAEYVQDNIINEAIDKMDVDYDNIDGISSAVFELLSEGALTFENLKEKLDELYLEDSNGNLYGSEATRIIFEEFGYDGIIDNSVSTKFRSMGLSSGTVHYIVFKPNQIKSATDNNGDFNRKNPDITYSLTTFADMAAGEHSRKTDIALSLIRHADAELRRWSRLFSGKTNTQQAAQELGRAQALMSAIYAKLEPKYRPKMRPQMKLIEVYARAIERGRISSLGQLSKEDRAALEQDIQAEFDKMEQAEFEEILSGVNVEVAHTYDTERSQAETRAMMQQAAQTIASKKASHLISEMLKTARRGLDRQLADQQRKRIARLFDSLTPKKLKNGKLGKGKVNATAYRQLGEYAKMLTATQEQKEKRMVELEASINSGKLEPKEQEKAELELKAWSAFGNVESMNYAAVSRALAALQEYAMTERTTWQAKLDAEKATPCVITIISPRRNTIH